MHTRSMLAGLTALVAASLPVTGFALPQATDGGGGGALGAVAAPEPEFTSNQVLVRFRAGTTRPAVDGLVQKAGGIGVVIAYRLVPDLYCVQVPEGTPRQVITALLGFPEVQYAEPDYVRTAHAQTTPYGINMVRAPQTWTDSRGQGVRVAVLDTGVDLTHPDLPTPVLTASFINGQAVDDLHTHGTHCSGTVLGLDNDIGVVGVAPQAQLMIGKVLSNGGSGSDAGVLAGIEWAVENGAKVISMSLGGGGASQAGQDVITATVAANVVIMASAGNSNNDIPSYPASYAGCMSIAAVDSNQNRASFSNFGPHISVSAPGVNVLSTVPIISATATWGGTPRNGVIMTGSAIGSATGQAVYCGVGSQPSDFPALVSGNIAHIRRGGDANGSVTFQTKVENALDAGAIGVIISNNVSGNFAGGTLNMNVPIPVVGINQADGDTLQAAGSPVTTVAIGQSGHGYANKSGTSMSCPHVAGVAALIIGGVAPQTPTVAQVRAAIEQSATDLGDAGWDPLFGHGLVNAEAALAHLRAQLGGGCGTADFDGDGDTGTDADIEAFFACLAGNCCGTCFSAGADFDGDGDTGTDADIEAFFRVLAGNPC